MISVGEAHELLAKVVMSLTPVTKKLDAALGSVLAEDVMSPLDQPRFHNSAMDGFALRAEDTRLASRQNPVRLKVCGMIAAGRVGHHVAKEGETLQVMTGAPLPSSCNAVVPQELVSQTSDGCIVVHEPVDVGAHVRFKAEELCKGALALPRGTALTPATLAFLAGIGVSEVAVLALPSVCILPTGNELVQRIEDLDDGKILESNSVALKHALYALHIAPRVSVPLLDDAKLLKHELEKSLREHDVVILCGGVSVGVYDLVKNVLAELDVETVFWGVAQKPGKPLFVGKRGRTCIFGLPGNPAASLVCFYEYVLPSIKRMMGYKQASLAKTRAKLTHGMKKRDQKTHFLRGLASYQEGELLVQTAGQQGSHCMSSFATANCLVVFPEQEQEKNIGDAVEIHWLPET